jgi:hypothetical protein
LQPEQQLHSHAKVAGIILFKGEQQCHIFVDKITNPTVTRVIITPPETAAPRIALDPDFLEDSLYNAASRLETLYA